MILTLLHKEGKLPELRASARYNQDLQSILEQLNEYRGPDNQIKAIYNQFGEEIPLEYQLRNSLTLFYKLF